MNSLSIICSSCKKEISNLTDDYWIVLNEEYCSHCATEIITEKAEPVILTTTNHIDGFLVEEYVDIVTSEVVLGTGFFSEFSGDFADFFGLRSTGFERKLQDAKKAAFLQLKAQAVIHGGNAVIGVDFDYTEFSGNRVGVIANGTIVHLVPATEEYVSKHSKRIL